MAASFDRMAKKMVLRLISLLIRSNGLGVNLRSMLLAKAYEGEHFDLSVVYELCQFREPRPRAVGNLAPLPSRGVELSSTNAVRKAP